MQMTTKPAETGASISIPSVKGTAGKRGLPVPSSLRSSAAPYLERWASKSTHFPAWEVLWL
jgi:hypothetical protein